MLPIAVLVFHFVIFSQGVYESYPWVDIPMHFMGGFSAAISLLGFGSYLMERKLMGKLDKVALFFFAISMVALIAVLWEFMEFGLDFIVDFKTQLSLKDTIGDLFMGLIGGVFGYFAYLSRSYWSGSR